MASKSRLRRHEAPLSSKRHLYAALTQPKGVCCVSTHGIVDALHAEALTGGSGQKNLSSVLLPRNKGSQPLAQSFIRHEIRRHPDARRRGSHYTIASTEDMVPAAAEIVISGRLCAWVFGNRIDQDEYGFPVYPPVDLANVVEAAASGGLSGALQHQLTKTVHTPANKLAYQLSILEVTGALTRQGVYIAAEETGTGIDTMSGDHVRVDAGFSAPLIRTNLLTLLALRGVAQSTTALLERYDLGSVDHGSLLSKMVAVLRRAPGQRLPVRHLRHALNIVGKGAPTSAWMKMKTHGVATGLIKECIDLGLRCRDAAKDKEQCLMSHRAIRLASPYPVSSHLSAQPMLDRSSSRQLLDTLSQCGTKGSLAGALATALLAHPRHVTKLTSMSVKDLGTFRRPEQVGRAKSFRYFAFGFSDSKSTASSQHEPSRVRTEATTLQQVQRRCAASSTLPVVIGVS